MVLACKSDLSHRIEPQRALDLLQKYDVGLIEVSDAEDFDKDKIKRSFEFLLRAVDRVLRKSFFCTTQLRCLQMYRWDIR